MKTKIKDHCILLFFSIFLLTSCSSHTFFFHPKSLTYTDWKIHKRSISRIIHYQARGTFVYISGTQKIYARFYFQQNNNRSYRLIIMNAFGNNAIDLTVKPFMVKILVNHKKKCYITYNPELILKSFIGMDIPIRNIQKWILGLPGDSTNFILNKRGYIKKINYTKKGISWLIEYKNYHNNMILPLPNNMNIYIYGKYIKLKIDNWSL